MSNDAPAKTASAATQKPIAMQLKKNYAPRELVRIVGYNRQEIRAKDAGGREQIIQTAEFIPDLMSPPAYPGVGMVGKIWAGTVIEVTEAEAKDMRSKGIAEVYL